MKVLRLAILLAVASWLAALSVLFFGVRPNVAHTLGHLLGDTAATQPLLTTGVALPALGMTARPIFLLVWAVLFGGPVLIAAQASLLPDERLLRAHAAAVTLYAAIAGLLGVLILAGIFLPFALL